MNNTGQDETSVIGNAMSALEERLGPGLEQARQSLDELNRKAIKVMRERPGTCLLCALGLGFLLGRLASKL